MTTSRHNSAEQQAPQQQQQDDEDDVDFFVDPKTAVSRAIDNHPKIKEAASLYTTIQTTGYSCTA